MDRKNGAFIHFSNFDNLYWGFVDIIESIETIPFQIYIPIKSVLYKYLKKDMKFTNEMLKRFNYPNIAKSSIGDFCNYMCNLRSSSLNHFNSGFKIIKNELKKEKITIIYNAAQNGISLEKI